MLLGNSIYQGIKMENVDKLSMCRICLVENVRMYVVTNKSLQEMYEKLTDIPFVTEDRRSMLACYICCSKLKQCCRLQRKCLEAEELLAQMLSEDYEQKPLTNQTQLEFAGGFIISPIENISLVERYKTECIAIKQEIAAVCEEQCDVELTAEIPREEFDSEYEDISHRDIEDTPALHLTSKSEDGELVMMIKKETEDEQELFEQEHRVSETQNLEPEIPNKSYSDVEEIPAYHSESDSEDIPLMEVIIEPEVVLEVSKTTRRDRVMRRAGVTEKTKLNSRKRKLEHSVPAEQTMNELSNSTIAQTNKTQMGKSRAEYMRNYRQKKREEKLKTEGVQLKKIARNSTQRSRDFRARVASTILSQTSTT